MDFGRRLHKAKAGRLFVREVRGDAGERFHLIGAVMQLPAFTALENMHEVRVNDHFWIDVENSQRPKTYLAAQDIKESGLGSLATSISFPKSMLSDCGMAFVRGTLLPPPGHTSQWAYVLTVLPLSSVFPDNGIYEFDAGVKGFRRIGTETHNGEAFETVFRLPIWGEGGQWGTSTSLEPTHFPHWLQGERASQARRGMEPEFFAYKVIMQERCPELHVYSATQFAERERISKEVLREIIARKHSQPQDPAMRRASRPA